mmetsp:Transcript_34292/g.86741  ORF Transcript_34292/g.86741 Transcript_34292/m.86741 type:complete len:215 (+) Transcript_34292:242-886(+)
MASRSGRSSTCTRRHTSTWARGGLACTRPASTTPGRAAPTRWWTSCTSRWRTCARAARASGSPRARRTTGARRLRTRTTSRRCGAPSWACPSSCRSLPARSATCSASWSATRPPCCRPSRAPCGTPCWRRRASLRWRARRSTLSRASSSPAASGWPCERHAGSGRAGRMKAARGGRALGSGQARARACMGWLVCLSPFACHVIKLGCYLCCLLT